jgi:hypothetical protein
MSQWVWVELIGLFEELPSEEVLLICSRFLEASLIPDDPFFVTRVCEKLLELGPYAPLKVYRSIAGNPMAMKAIEAWPRDHEKPLLTLLQAKAKATFSERHDLLQALDQWVHKTDFGKIMRLDWMWLHLQDGSLEGRESRVFIERLRLQSRRLEMAREAQLLKAKNF